MTDSFSDSEGSDGASLASSPPFSMPSSDYSSVTSHHNSSRSQSPTPSVWSLTPSLREQAFKREYGRDFNSYSEVYKLPADDEELERLNAQHELMESIMGKYVAPIPFALADDKPWEQKAVLDLGCGTGRWIMEAAQDFPNCNAVAVDLVPMQNPNMPANCRSEVDDINLGLEHFYGDFNVVHARYISSGIKDYQNLLDQIGRVLRPGGVMNVSEPNFQVYNAKRQQLDVDITKPLESPYLPRWIAFVRVAALAAGADIRAGVHMNEWVSQHPAFENAVCSRYWIPISTWDKSDPFQTHIGAKMRDNIISFLKAARPLLLGSGIPEETVDALEQNTERELVEDEMPGYIRLENIYAIKRAKRV